MSMADFEIKEQIGKGSFGSVFKAIRKADKGVYAVKQVDVNALKEKEKDNCVNEIRLLASLDHKNIVGYKEAFFDLSSNTVNIVMEYASLGDLKTVVEQSYKEHKRLREDVIVKYTRGMLEGLKFLHNRKIIHRDLKSANVFLSEEGEVKLGDFNVSRVVKSGLVQTQTGTPYYASPEVWADLPYDYKSDVWSAGCILYEMCTSAPPFRAENLDKLYRQVTKGEFESIPRVYSKRLSKLVKSMLQVNPEERCSVEEALAILSKKKNAWKEKQPEEDLLATIKFPKNSEDWDSILPDKKYNQRAKSSMPGKKRKDVSEDKKRPVSVHHRKKTSNKGVNAVKQPLKKSSSKKQTAVRQDSKKSIKQHKSQKSIKQLENKSSSKKNSKKKVTQVNRKPTKKKSKKEGETKVKQEKQGAVPAKEDLALGINAEEGEIVLKEGEMPFRDQILREEGETALKEGETEVREGRLVNLEEQLDSVRLDGDKPEGIAKPVEMPMLAINNTEESNVADIEGAAPEKIKRTRSQSGKPKRVVLSNKFSVDKGKPANNVIERPFSVRNYKDLHGPVIKSKINIDSAVIRHTPNYKPKIGLNKPKDIKLEGFKKMKMKQSEGARKYLRIGGAMVMANKESPREVKLPRISTTKIGETKVSASKGTGKYVRNYRQRASLNK